MNKILTAAALTAAIGLSSCGGSRTNPFFEAYDTPYEIPPFDKIEYSDYLPAVEKGIADQKAEIDAIVKQRSTPDFENTILAMEKSGELLNKVMLVFASLDETDNNEQMQELSEKIYPMVSEASDEIAMNPLLFEKVKYVYENRDSMGLDTAQKRAVEETYKSFARSGALLSDADKEQLKAVNKRLTDLYLTFNKNLLAATNEFELVVDNEEDLAGIPAGIVATAAEEAKARGKEGKWVFTLHAPSRLPVLKYADNRDVRKKMYEGYMNLASQAPYDNRPVINDIVHARAE
ncbi:MAG: peptidase M3, partial [Duncaniella sp.]|nr:peptidase M3 [Duncaniella sp.]